MKDDGVFGSLSVMNTIDLIQFYSTFRYSVILKVALNKNISGKIYIYSGEVYNAELKDLNGEEAFFEIAKWDKGFFKVEKLNHSPERKITKPCMNLLLELSKRMDEKYGDENILTKQDNELEVNDKNESYFLGLINKGLDCYKNKDYSLAKEFWLKAKEINPEDSFLINNLKMLEFTSYIKN